MRSFLQNRGCYVTLLTICILPCMAKFINEPDVWFHMACGKEMLSTGTVDVSKFYYTAVNTVIKDFEFTWLGDIILYLVHFIGGPVGLQILRAEIILLMLYFMWSVSDKKINLFKCLVGVLVVYGSVQLLVVRNSIFSVIFVCALWSLHLNDTKYKHMWSIIILVLWSQIHGSILLGICMYGLLAIRSMKSFAVVVSSGLIINHMLPLNVFDYFNVPDSLNLNSTLFHPQGIVSMDFLSPFKLERHFTAMMLMLSGICIIMIKRVRWIYIIVFLATLIPALGYIRMVGYHAITCGMCLMYAERRGDLRPPIKPVLLFLLIVLVGYQGWKFNDANMGVGVSPLFDSLRNQQVTRNVFTQDYLTSYVYFNYGEKGFFSTFHAPHPKYVYDAYTAYMSNPDVIDSSINTCVMKDRVFADRFFKSEKWVGAKQGHVYIFNRRGNYIPKL